MTFAESTPANQTWSMDMTKYVIKTNKPLSDLDDDEMLHLPIVPAKMKGAVYTAKSGNPMASER
jgi:hypothetical protein